MSIARPRLIIVQPGQKLSSLADVDGDFADWMLDGMGWSRTEATVIKPHLGEPLPNPAEVPAVLVTGSSAMVTDGSDWIEAGAAWLRQLVENGVPVLGICFGHQLLAHALGGLVRDNPNGVEVGTVSTRLTLGQPRIHCSAPCLRPSRSRPATARRWSNCPWETERLAASNVDPNRAFRIGASAWGIQFHPEFNQRIVRGYIDHYRADLEKSGRPVEAMIEQTEDLALPTQLLRGFARVLGGG